MEKVFLGLGSNKSFGALSSLELLRKACLELASCISDLRLSSVYRTSAMYFEAQDDFLNMVVSGLFRGSAFSLLNRINLIEQHFGRDRANEISNGPRTLDIDIELFGDAEIHEMSLTVPHERLCERKFVLVPLLELMHGEVSSSGEDEGRVKFYESKLAQIDDDESQRIEKLCALRV